MLRFNQCIRDNNTDVLFAQHPEPFTHNPAGLRRIDIFTPLHQPVAGAAKGQLIGEGSTKGIGQTTGAGTW
jgi:hypothetical protein